MTEKALAMARTPLASPEELCHQLGLVPTMRQRMELRELEREIPTHNVTGDADEEVLRAVSIALLWRVLREPGTRGIVLAAGDPDEIANPVKRLRSGRAGYEFMRFLIDVCMHKDPNLSEVTHPVAWNRLKFGVEEGWEIRMLHNHAETVRELAPRAQIGVLIGAGSSDPAFVEAAHALEDGLPLVGSTLIRLW